MVVSEPLTNVVVPSILQEESKGKWEREEYIVAVLTAEDGSLSLCLVRYAINTF